MERKKALADMTHLELMEEVRSLDFKVERLTKKNKARKRALKDMNRSVLVTSHFAKAAHCEREHWKRKFERVANATEDRHFEEEASRYRSSFLRNLFGRRVKGVIGA